MRIVLLCVGKLHEQWQKEGVKEYIKRLSRFGSFEIREVPDFPEYVKSTSAIDQKTLDKEGVALLRQIRPDDRVIAFAIKGKMCDSPGFAHYLQRWKNDGRRLVFVIGGSLGLSPAVLDRADEMISFSQLTFPHGLMRVIALEQIYRACKILAGERYHK